MSLRRFNLVFTTNDPDDAAVIRAIRFLLKRMLRNLGFRALSIVETTPAAGEQAPLRIAESSKEPRGETP